MGPAFVLLSYSPAAVEEAARTCGRFLVVVGSALTERGLALAQQIAGMTGCTVISQTF